MAEQVDTSLPAGLDPRVLDPIAPELEVGRNTAGVPVFHDGFTKAKGTFDALRATTAQLTEADRALKARDGAALSPTDAERLRRGATTRLEGARKSVGATLETLDTHLGQVEASIGETLGLPEMRSVVTTAGRGADVRAALRGLGKAERLAAIRSAVAEGDRESVAAVLAAPPLASGLTTADVKLLRMEAERQFAPTQTNLRASLTKLRGMVERASSIVEGRFGPLVGAGESKAAKAEKALRALENANS